MRPLGDFRRLLFILGTGLALVTFGVGVSQAGTPAHPATSAHAMALALPRYGNSAGHAAVPPAARAVNTSHPNHVIRNCTSAAVVRAVAKGGIITFSCGPNPV